MEIDRFVKEHSDSWVILYILCQRHSIIFDIDRQNISPSCVLLLLMLQTRNWKEMISAHVGTSYVLCVTLMILHTFEIGK